MSAVDALRAVAAGQRPNGELLQPCRLEAFGGDFFSEEAIVQSFRTASLSISDDATVVETDSHVAIFDGPNALIADVFSGNIARIWRLGPGAPAEGERAIGVPFDTDLTQSRGDLAMRREDHPLLAAEAFSAVEEAGRSLARNWTADDGPPPFRARSFLIRGFTGRGATAALFAVHTLSSATARTVGFTYAAALLDSGGASSTIVRDKAGEAALEARPWTPVVA